MNRGLYAQKHWNSEVLTGVREHLARRGVSPNAVTVAGVCCGALVGAVLALVPSPPVAAALVALLLAARLAAANLDGALARETGKTTRWGSVCNELGRVHDVGP